ncbi:PREDICTED: uncharacterized protein LOC106804625 [Priapulus caudatus]|uniref:Uncharacterized protein LOC106804625 n=1 Tax=Priapulus caudatus TaxID=37621 RepID=A0ABM1DN56_PRICU|nr:PREDICTED: uncharacterized protein LOC106804625 [Priapulus caudatus]XP_014661378.1 PREDICTED: uncharacterized protein LOC106804625 [Priapulus caudatus]
MLLVILMTLVHYGTSVHAIELMSNEITCRGDNIEMELFFSDPFYGEVYADRFHSDANCRIWGTGSRFVVLKFDHWGCGVVENTSEKTYQVFVNVAQRQNLIKADDQAFLVTCHYDIDMSVTISANELEVGQLSTALVHNTPPPPQIRLTVWEGSDNDGKTTPATFVDIGESLLLVASLEDASIYQNILLYDCRAFSAADQSFQVQLVDSAECVNSGLVDDIIQTENVQKSVGGDSPVEKWIAFRAFKFPDADIVRFQCQAFACFLASDCDDTCSPVRRRKRETEEEFIQSDVPTLTLSGEIRVRTTNSSPTSQASHTSHRNDICLPAPALSVGLAVIIVIIIAIAAVATIRCRRTYDDTEVLVTSFRRNSDARQ